MKTILILYLFTSISISELPAQTVKSLSITDEFYHSGYMGCRDNIVVNQNYNGGVLHEHCYKITTKVCPDLWSGVFWQFPANNWCKTNGMNISTEGFTRITFLIKGEKGEEVVFLKSGNDSCDSYSTRREKAVLKKEWQKIQIDLSGKNLSNVSCPFGWFVEFKSNLDEVTFYIDNLKFE